MEVNCIHPDVRPSVDEVSERFEKKCSIHFIPDIYPYGVNILARIHFRVPAVKFGPLMAKYLSENGVSFFFNYLLYSFDTWHLPL